MFHHREDAGRQLADRLRHHNFTQPIVLAIPRGGVVVGAVLARALNAELDVVLSRKLRAPNHSEFAIGAISEGGEVYLHLNDYALRAFGVDEEYLHGEKHFQLTEIARRNKLFREVRPRAKIAGRSVIVTDDGVATGSTMIAALHLLATQSPREIIVAIPVGSPDRLTDVRSCCDELICLHSPRDFYAIGQFYEDFKQVEDADVVALLQEQSIERETQPAQ